MNKNKQLDSPRVPVQERIQSQRGDRNKNSKGLGEQLSVWVDSLMPARF